MRWIQPRWNRLIVRCNCFFLLLSVQIFNPFYAQVELANGEWANSFSPNSYGGGGRCAVIALSATLHTEYHCTVRIYKWVLKSLIHCVCVGLLKILVTGLPSSSSWQYLGALYNEKYHSV